MADSQDADAAFAAARTALAHPQFAWITRSSLTEKAYFLGLLHGLAVLDVGDSIGKAAFRHLADTASPRPGDDAFSESPFSRALDLIREAIADPRQPELDTLDGGLGCLVAHLAEVQRERAIAAGAVHAAVAAIQPFTTGDAFRILGASEHAHLQEIVQSLEAQLRVLALVELRLKARLGLES